MTLIKCPHCGHTVLSVASHCPSCSQALSSRFLGPEHQGELAECRSCGHAVRSGSRTCPDCGIRNPAPGRHLAQRARQVFATVVLAAVVSGLWHRLSGPLPAASDAGKGLRVVKAVRLSAAPPEPSLGERRAVPAPATGWAHRSAAARWTTGWANVREQPTTTAPVLRVLRPGTLLEGISYQLGWWSVPLGGDTVGYVAGSLVGRDAPGDTAPSAVRPRDRGALTAEEGRSPTPDH